MVKSTTGRAKRRGNQGGSGIESGSGGLNTNPSSSASSRKKEKVYCVCRTPYDETK